MPLQAQKGGGGIGLLIIHPGTRMEWMVSTMYFTPGERNPLPIAQEAGWASGPV